MNLISSLIILPFTLGLIFLLSTLTMNYFHWYSQMTIRNKIRLRKAFTGKLLLSSIREIFRECLLHIRIYSINRRLWYMHMTFAFGWFLLIFTGHLESVFSTGKIFTTPWESVFFDYFTRTGTDWQFQDLFSHLMDFILLFILSGLAFALLKRFNSGLMGFKKRPLHSLPDRIAMLFLWMIFPFRFFAESLNSVFYGGGGFLTGFGGLIHLPQNLNILSDISWILYSTVLGGFFIVMPRSRYMHILTEIPHIFLKNAGIRAYLDKGCTEFQVHSCSSCGICQNTCQLTELNINQGQTYYFIREVRKSHSVPDVNTMQCLMCGRCQDVCPVQIEPLAIRMNERIRMNNYLGYNFSGLDRNQKPSSSGIAFFGGCMTSLTPGITASMKKIFNFYNEDYTIVDETDAFCCGRPLYLSGQKQAYFELMKYSRNKILSTNPRLIITSCPICLNSFRTNYMFPVPVIHHSQYIDSKLNQGEFLPYNSRQKTIYHDSCELSRFQSIYREPRNILSRLVDLQNGIYNKENQFCCGGSVADGESDFKDKSLIAAKSIKQMIKPDTKLLATACPACKITFKSADILPVMDISEIYAESLNMEMHTKRLSKKSLHYQPGF